MKNYTKLKIGLVLDDSLDRVENGVQQYVNSLGIWLSKQGHDVHYLVGETNASTDKVHSLAKNLTVRFNHNKLSIPYYAVVSVIKNLLKRQKFDVLHIQLPYSPVLGGKILKCSSDDCAVVGTFHILPYGLLQRISNKALGVVQKTSLARIDAICSVSLPAKKFALSHYGLQSSVIPNTIDISRWQNKNEVVSGRIVYLGRLVPRKGCYELLKAIKALPKQTKNNIQVIIASDGPERPMLDKFALDNRLGCVKFVGFIDEQSKIKLLSSAEIAVFPSLGGESFGIVLIEAMAAGSGVVMGGNNPGYASVIGSWDECIFDPNNTAEFSSKIELLLRDSKLRKSIHDSQQEAVLQYDTEVVGTQILKMYETALLQRRQDMR